LKKFLFLSSLIILVLVGCSDTKEASSKEGVKDHEQKEQDLVEHKQPIELNNEDKTDSPKEKRIIKGELVVNGLRLGDSEEKIAEEFGEPLKVEEGEDDMKYYFFKKTGFGLFAKYDKSNSIQSVSFIPVYLRDNVPHKKSQVIEAYGPPTNVGETECFHTICDTLQYETKEEILSFTIHPNEEDVERIELKKID